MECILQFRIIKYIKVDLMHVKYAKFISIFKNNLIEMLTFFFK